MQGFRRIKLGLDISSPRIQCLGHRILQGRGDNLQVLGVFGQQAQGFGAHQSSSDPPGPETRTICAPHAPSFSSSRSNPRSRW